MHKYTSDVYRLLYTQRYKYINTDSEMLSAILRDGQEDYIVWGAVEDMGKPIWNR